MRRKPRSVEPVAPLDKDDEVQLGRRERRQAARTRLLKASYCDLADLVGILIWLIGCALFLPAASADPAMLSQGCLLFLLGEAIYGGLYGFLLREAYRGPGAWSLEALEATMGLVGVGGFFLGTLLFLPDGLPAPDAVVAGLGMLKRGASGPSALLNLPGDAASLQKEAGPSFEGAWLFVVGSIGFSLSYLSSAMGLRAFESRGERLAAVATALHMGGCLFFCFGSMGFIDQVGCGSRMVAIGAWCYIVGCALFAAGAVVALVRDYVAFVAEKDDLDNAEFVAEKDDLDAYEEADDSMSSSESGD